jgi:hypothetical protein
MGFFDPQGSDKIYFDQFRRSPHELSYLAVHDFRYLQMKNIYYYQMELLQNYPSGTVLNQGNYKELRSLLQNYCNAVRDYEFMVRLPKPSKKKIRRQRECLEHLGPGQNIDRNDHRVIRGHTVGFLDRMFSEDLSDAAPNSKITWRGKVDILCRDLSLRGIVRRSCVGLLGTTFLLVPMIILQFYRTTAWKLSTVSIAVVLFSVVLAICSDQSNGEHLVAVAAYAAVMVVFVGTTTS